MRRERERVACGSGEMEGENTERNRAGMFIRYGRVQVNLITDVKYGP